MLFSIVYIGNIDFVYVNSTRFKHVGSSCHFLELNCKRLYLYFLKLKQLLTDGDIESSSELTQNDSKSPVGHQKKIKIFKGTSKKCDLNKSNVIANFY